jgi:hypothetical protein
MRQTFFPILLPLLFEIERCVDSSRWTHRGHFKIIGASAPGRSRNQHFPLRSNAILADYRFLK